jgi:hypothetical protein
MNAHRIQQGMTKHRAQNTDENDAHGADGRNPAEAAATAIAIGVVTDLGRIEAAICGEAPINSATDVR